MAEPAEHATRCGFVALIGAAFAWFHKADEKLWRDQDARWQSNHVDHERFWSRSNDFNSRIDKLETEFAHMPRTDVTHRLETALTELRGEMRRLEQKLDPIGKVSDRLQEFLFQQSDRK